MDIMGQVGGKMLVVSSLGELNLQDWKMTAEVAGVENDGVPIDGRDHRSG